MSKSSLTIAQDGEKVVLLMNGRYVCDMPWHIADETARILKSVARKAEEYAKANQVIAHDALLIRTGAPFRLSDDPKIRDAAMTEAQWGDARKRMPLRAVDSPREVFAPSLIKHPRSIQ